MAKDPAMLWYWNDWHGGTSTFTRHLKGCYMDLLHAQFNSGHLSLEEIKTVLGNDFAVWGTLSKKFAVDETGKYFNERMDSEIIKRRAYSESRRKNRLNKDMSLHISDHMIGHVEIENENKDETVIKKGGVGERFELSLKIELPNETLETAELNQYTLTKKKNSEFIQSQWLVFMSERIHDPPEKQFQYQKLPDLTSYFLNWVRNKHPKNGKNTGASFNKPVPEENGQRGFGRL